MPRFGLFFKFEGKELKTDYFSDTASAYALDHGWELVGWEPRSEAEQIADVRDQEEHKWDPALLQRAWFNLHRRTQP